MRWCRAIASLGMLLILGCGAGQPGAGGDASSSAVTGEVSSAGLPVVQGKTTYNISLDIHSSEYVPQELGGFLIELDIPPGVEPAVVPGGDVAGTFLASSPIGLRSECFSPETLAVAAWMPATRTLRLALVSAYSMKRFGQCVDIQLPLNAGFASVPAGMKAQVTEVALYRDSVESDGDPGKLSVAQVVELQ